MPKAIVFGGSGQIGSAIAAKLKAHNWNVVIPVRKRRAEDKEFLPFSTSEETLGAYLAGCDAVINCIGILAPQGRDTFESIHRVLPARLAKCAAQSGVKQFVHLSALGADINSPSAYARSKAEGENAVKIHFPDAIIFRPSIVFGPRDRFFNRFAAMARFLPALPLMGGGHGRFQPVYVGDVADAAHVALSLADGNGKTYNLGGPKTYSFRELMEYILKGIGKKRLLLPIPWPIAEIQAFVFENLPGKILTRDQLKLLKTDNCIMDTLPALADLGIQPQPIEVIVPQYLFKRNPAA